jgi:hypothetical protein
MEEKIGKYVCAFPGLVGVFDCQKHQDTDIRNNSLRLPVYCLSLLLRQGRNFALTTLVRWRVKL